MTDAPIVEIDLDDPTPPYAQLRHRLAALIDLGVLASGQRLPTVRQLAGDLGVAAGTVMRAYKELEGAGYVHGDGRRGTVVADSSARNTADPDGALRALAQAYCRAAARIGARAEQMLAAVSQELTEPPARGPIGPHPLSSDPISADR